MLKRSFFLKPDGTVNDPLKISFIWSKALEAYRNECYRNIVLTGITTWLEFERILKNAELSVKANKAASSSTNATGGKRAASQQQTRPTNHKKFDRKPS